MPIRSATSVATLVACLAALVFLGAAVAGDAAICDVAVHPNSYDHKQVEVLGLASDVKMTTSHHGNDYTTFKLIDPSGCGSIKVFVWQHPALMSGDRIRVEGVFETQHHEGKYTFTNELQAETLTKPN